MRKLMLVVAAVAALSFGVGCGTSSSARVPSGTFHCNVNRNDCQTGLDDMKSQLCTRGINQARITEVVEGTDGITGESYERQRTTKTCNCP
jgi:hypothetical protein